MLSWGMGLIKAQGDRRLQLDKWQALSHNIKRLLSQSKREMKMKMKMEKMADDAGGSCGRREALKRESVCVCECGGG